MAKQSIAAIRRKALYPWPVYQAEFADGTIGRMTVWQQAGKPWDFERGRKLCGPYYGNKDHVYGNIFEESFQKIWDSKRTAEIHQHAACGLDISKCMPNCRPDAVNRFLWETKHPPAHVNFI